MIILECTKCARTTGGLDDPSDPPGTHKIKTLCPECARGDFSLVDYFDKDGKQLYPSHSGDARDA